MHTDSALNLNPRVLARLAFGLAIALVSARATIAEDVAGETPRPRTPWSNTRLVGSPEPPLPYTTHKVFPQLELPAPMYLMPVPGTDHLVAVLQASGGKPARIVRFANRADVTASEVIYEAPDRLIYSIIFDPEFARNRHVYVFANGPQSQAERQNRVSRFRLTDDEPPRIAPDSELVILEWRSAGHDGGDMAFGRDEMLYLTTGDGTSDSDGWNSGQTLDDLLGAVLRIDVRQANRQEPYRVPIDNPFVRTPGARPEIFAYGLRNPWRMGIDARSGRIWVGNNGQDLWETAHLVRAGENYGWSVFEGNHPFYLQRERGPTPIVPPTIEHSHAEFRSLTGGIVYHGVGLPELKGVYIYGDYSSGRIWGMLHDGQQVVWHRELADTSLMIAAFCQDRQGRLLVVDHGGGIFEIVPTEPPAQPQMAFPTLLSETGLFSDVSAHSVAPGVIAYDVNAPAWADGAAAERFLAVPGDKKVGFNRAASWSFPDGTALVQTLSLPAAGNRADASPRRIETRVLLKQQGEWAGYSYRWNDQQTDAVLVGREGEELANRLPGEAESAPTHVWRIPSRVECLTCHSRAAGFVLGVSGWQLDRPEPAGLGGTNQLETLASLGLFKEPVLAAEATQPVLVDPYDAAAELESRARSYLHVNCSACHVAAGGGNARMELGLATPREKMELVEARPQHDTFGIVNAMLVAPGDPARSVLVHRLQTRGRGQMPPLVTARVDEAAVELMRQWIAGLKPSRPFVRAWKAEDLADELTALAERPEEPGEKLFTEIGCAQCHRIGEAGSSVGPDLSDVAARLSAPQLLESILQPSVQIADRYATWLVQTADGHVHKGHIEHEDGERLKLRLAEDATAAVSIPIAEVEARRKSDLSNMPAGMVDVLERQEVLDLLAYLLRQRGSEGKDASANLSP